MAISLLKPTLLASLKDGSDVCSRTEASRVYYVVADEATDSAADARDFIESHEDLDGSVGSLILSNVTAKETRSPFEDAGGVKHLYEVTAAYSAAPGGGGGGGGGGSSFIGENLPEAGFAFTSPGGRIFHSRGGGYAWDFKDDLNEDDHLEAMNFAFEDNPLFPGVVGVKRGSRGWEHEGVELPPPVVNLGPFTIYVPPSWVTGAFVRQLAALVAGGAVNHDTVTIGGEDYSRGELRMVEVRGRSQSVDAFAITYGIHYIPNTNQINVAGETLVAFAGVGGTGGLGGTDLVKLGHDLFWTISEETISSDTSQPGLALRYAFTDEVWEYVDFADFIPTDPS